MQRPCTSYVSNEQKMKKAQTLICLLILIFMDTKEIRNSI